MSKSILISKKDEWGTPQKLFDELDKKYNFTLDPCANKKRVLKENMISLDIKDNGLLYNFSNHSVFINPPYSKNNIQKWCKKIYDEKDKVGVIVLIIPVTKLSNKYFHQYIYPYCKIEIQQGRLSFFPLNNQNNNSNPVGSVICIIGRELL